jgi:hypothetical protein
MEHQEWMLSGSESLFDVLCRLELLTPAAEMACRIASHRISAEALGELCDLVSVREDEDESSKDLVRRRRAYLSTQFRAVDKRMLFPVKLDVAQRTPFFVLARGENTRAMQQLVEQEAQTLQQQATEQAPEEAAQSEQEVEDRSRGDHW